MDAIARSISVLVDQAVRDNLDRDHVVKLIDEAERHGRAESSREALRGMRYFARNGVPPLSFMPSDFEAIKPLIEALVKRGLENGGMPQEALAAFPAN